MSQAKSEGKKAIKAGMGYTIGNILVKGIAFLTIPIFTALMSTAQYGIFNTYQAYLSILAVIVSLGLPTSVRNVRYDMQDEEKKYHSNSLCLMIIALLVSFVLALVCRSLFSELLGLPVPFLMIIVVNSTCVAIQSYYNNILTIDFRYREFLRLSFFYSFSSVLLSVILISTVFREDTALGRAIGNVTPMLVIGLYAGIKIWKEAKPQMNRGLTSYGLRFGLPLIPNDLSSLILTQFDRIMIFRYIGEAESGLYSFAYNVAVIYQVIASSIESAWTPWMFGQLHEEEHENLKKMIDIYVIILSVGTILLILGSPELIMLLSSRSYWDSRTVVIPIVTAIYFYAIASIPVGMEFYCKKTAWISICTFCTAGCNIVLNGIFLPRYGYTAAAYTTLASYFMYCLFHMYAGGRLLKIYLWKRLKVILSAGIVLFVSFLAEWQLDAVQFRWGILFVMGFMILAGGIRYRKLLLHMLHSFRKK